MANRARFVAGLIIVTLGAAPFAVAFRAPLVAVYQLFYGADTVDRSPGCRRRYSWRPSVGAITSGLRAVASPRKRTAEQHPRFRISINGVAVRVIANILATRASVRAPCWPHCCSTAC